MMSVNWRGLAATMAASAGLLIVICCMDANVIEFAFSQSEDRKERKDTDTIVNRIQNTGDSADEVQSLINVLKHERQGNPEIIFEAIQRLGMIGDKRAIPILIDYIGFERKFEPRQKPYPGTVDHWDDPKPLPTRFPAISALFGIGKASVPALIGVIEDNPIDSVKSRNALFTIHFIFRDDLSRATEYLVDALNRAISLEKQRRISAAIEKTRLEKANQEKNL